MALKEGDKVKVEYTGTMDDGTVFDASEKHGKPLEFEIGKNLVIPGFEKAIAGMKKGEEKEIKLSAEEAYGAPKPELLKQMPRSQLPQDQEPKLGMMLIVSMQNGTQVPAKITDVTDKDVTIDLNHPLAGKNLNFKLKLVDISEGGNEEPAEEPKAEEEKKE